VACPRCRRELLYTHIYFAHLGRYRCPSCGFHRPEPIFKLRQLELSSEEGTAIKMSLRGSPLRATLPLPGIYNLYTALAAAAAASAFGLSGAAVQEALGNAAPPSGRMERRRIASRELLIALIKNPAGANQVLQTLLQEKQERQIHLLIAINDHPADGTDISWLWETDFEQLAAARAQIGSITISGTRAPETARRLEEAGLSPDRMTVEPALPRALRQALLSTAPGEKLIVLPNYTAMRQLQRNLDRIMAEPSSQ
jgi:UDP-N-acetylmuramyl tripeptide synthase